MTIHEITEYCREEAKKHWDLNFYLPIRINGRMLNTLGKLISNINLRTGEIFPQEMVLSKKAILYHSDEILKKIILHELTHWAMQICGKAHKDGHPEFEKELVRVGSITTGVLKHVGEIYQIQCTCCNKMIGELNSKIRANKILKKSISKCCSAKLSYDTIIISDK